MYKNYVKAVLDNMIALVILTLTSPLILIISIIVYCNLGKPIFFKQERPGLKGEVFKMYKFRTMQDFKDKEENYLSDEMRLTKFGKFLRKTSLDELPELANVLKGEMSLVGPRPLLVEYLDKYTPEQARRHEVRPGITGWAQVNGRNSISWEEKFKLDVWYVDNISFLLDIKILFRTIATVFKRNGISQTNHVTTERFKGYNNGVDM